jgi:3-keto-disaccharide hydrolase
MCRRALAHGSRLFGAMLLLSCAAEARAAEPKVPEPISLDFLMQGEYAGPVFTQLAESTPVGVQVVALGGGKFSAVGFIGGLPGDGWDRSPRREGKGEIKDGVAEFKSEEHTSSIKDGVLSISVGQVKISDLKKQDRRSHTLGAPPPPGAIVLFDGSNTDQFAGGRIDEDHLLLPGCTSKQPLGAGTLHIEFRVPFLPEARDLSRGNSGVFIQSRYEIQILDSFGEEASDKGGGAIFSVHAPEQNMCFPPLSWQTYDVDFVAGQYQDGKPLDGAEPMITVRHNGRPIHTALKLPGPTPGAPLAAGGEPAPLFLEDHADPIRFRNIWFLPAAAEKPAETAGEKK